MLFLTGLIIGLLLLLALGMSLRGARIAWYEWLLMAIGGALMLFSAQNYQAAVSDFEPGAPGVFLLLFGLPGLVLFLVGAALAAWGFVRKRKATAPAAA